VTELESVSPHPPSSPARSLLWARKVTVLLTMGIVIGAAFLAESVQPVDYASVASVVVETPADAPAGTKPNMATEKQIAGSTVVAQMVIERLHVQTTPSEILNGLRIDVPVDTEVLHFVFTSPYPEEARRGAQAFAEAYIAYSQDRAQAEAAGVSESLKGRVDELTARLSEAEQSASAGRSSSSARAEASALIAQIGILEQKLASVTAGSTQGGTIVGRATLPDAAAGHSPLEILVLGILSGGLLGTAAAFVRDRTDDRLRGAADLERCLGAPVIADVPALPPGTPPEVLVRDEPRSAIADAFRRARTALLGALPDQRGTVLVTSADDRRLQSVAVVNLAVTLAASGRRILVVCADPRRSGEDESCVERLFDASGRVGLAEVLRSGLPLETALRRTEIDGLRVLPAGAGLEDAVDLLDSAAARGLVAQLADRADVVLIDGAPLLSGPGGMELAGMCDAALVVVDGRRGRRRATRSAAAQLHAAGVPAIVGLRMNASGHPWIAGTIVARAATEPTTTSVTIPTAEPEDRPAAAAVAGKA
jgi:Mrp family chromosome partitioning ATPase/capsular polysaccharide biosynthesis protein